MVLGMLYRNMVTQRMFLSVTLATNIALKLGWILGFSAGGGSGLVVLIQRRNVRKHCPTDLTINTVSQDLQAPIKRHNSEVLRMIS